MNRWLVIRRLRAPAFLILFGVLALLNQWHVIGFRRSWPLFLILGGLLLLAERTALAPPAPSPESYLAGANFHAPASTTAPATGDSAPPSEEIPSSQPDETSGGRWRA